MITPLAVYLHTLDPYAIKLWDGGPIRWYGLSYLLGFLVAYGLIRHMVRVGRSSMDPSMVGDFLVAVAIGVVVGGRLGYVLFYRPQMLWTFSSQLPYWDVLAINKGGMASHGGMIGVILAGLWHARRARGGPHSWLHLLDLTAFSAPLGLSFGRVANFINGELVGRPCSPNLPWAVKFPQEMFNWDRIQTTRLAQAISKWSSGQESMPHDIEYHVPLLIEQIQSGNQELIRLVEPLLAPRHPSQIYQAVLEGLCLFAILAVAWRRPRKPGVIGGLFCCAYALLRVVGECFRQPDAHIGFQALGLTRGQWLSILLLAGGLVAVWVSAQRHAMPLGGWWTGSQSKKNDSPVHKQA